MVKFIIPFLILPAKTPLWGFLHFESCELSKLYKKGSCQKFFSWLKGGGVSCLGCRTSALIPEPGRMSLGFLLKAEIISHGLDHNRFSSCQKRIGFGCFKLQFPYQHNSWERDLLSRMQDLRPDPGAWEILGQQQHILYSQYRIQNCRFKSIK